MCCTNDPAGQLQLFHSTLWWPLPCAAQRGCGDPLLRRFCLTLVQEPLPCGASVVDQAFAPCFCFLVPCQVLQRARTRKLHAPTYTFFYKVDHADVDMRLVPLLGRNELPVLSEGLHWKVSAEATKPSRTGPQSGKWYSKGTLKLQWRQGVQALMSSPQWCRMVNHQDSDKWHIFSTPTVEAATCLSIVACAASMQVMSSMLTPHPTGCLERSAGTGSRYQLIHGY